MGCHICDSLFSATKARQTIMPGLSDEGKESVMNVIEAEQYLEEINKYGSVLGLKSITTLLEALGNPQKELQVVHIAGTNGKGSTLAFVERVLMEAGYKVGRYSSPAVFQKEEIIRINDRNIPQEAFARIVTLMKEKADGIFEKYGFHPTVFEVETALAFAYFKEEHCDIVLVECGMGGESDATNVFEQVLCSVISSISLDHTAFLGDTLEEIAGVKAGIIKNQCPVVVAAQNDTVLNVIKNRAMKKNTSAIVADRAHLEIRHGLNHISYRASNGKIYETDIQMFGTYQGINVATAIETLLCLETKGYVVENYIEQGLSKARWSGRMETVLENPLFLIDGAHNPGAVRELRDSMDLYFTNKRITFIMGVLADKDFQQEAEIIAPRAENIITITPNHDRALDGRILAETVSKYNPHVCYADSISDGVKLAIDSVEQEHSDMIIAFGSLSHLREIKQAVKAERRD